MSFMQPVVDFIVKQIWPFIIEHVWPAIKTEVIRLCTKLIAKFFKAIHSLIDSRNKKTTGAFEEKAKQAEEKAASAKSEQDRERWQTVAQVWHEAAHTLVRENADLKMQLAELMVRQSEEIESEVRAIAPQINGDVMTVGQEKILLSKLD